ncbi:hypothetical protein CL619_01500 [archaeon]|nr:hypothetical protein [archaeon]|tara:strand:- start:518 stop:949 length:432 start_codon:yes stop_codon:yes gene_type:complete
MADYSISGHYEYLGTQGDLTGRLSTNEQGLLSGEIIDHGSRSPNQTMEGKVEVGDGRATLAFFKCPPDTGLANLLYVLQRDGEGEDLSGLYQGTWAALPRQIVVGAIAETESSSAAALFIVEQQPDYVGGEYAELRLEKILDA